MGIRSTETHVTFQHPFQLAAFSDPQPAGTYLVVTEEEQIEGLSFIAFRRTATTLYIPDISSRLGIQQGYPTTDGEIDAALETDVMKQILS